MRSLLLLFFGATIGVIGTLMFFTLDPSFQTDERNGAGGGNARISFDEEALATLIAGQLAGLPGFGPDTRIDVSVEPNGLVEVRTTIGAGGVGVRGSFVLNPDIEAGRLKVHVVSASLGDLAVPGDVSGLIERPLQERLDSLADGLDYRLTSITTTDHRLTLEIEI